MRTNIVLDETLVREAMAIYRLQTKREAVDFALQELVRRGRKKDLSELAGRISIVDGYDPKRLRAARGDQRGRR